MAKSAHNAWYAAGLAFTCQGCGNCCRGPGGYVWVSEEEAQAIARTLQRPFREFAAALLRSTSSGLALVDDARGDCPLLGGDSRCLVYDARPRQCRTWPWWEENLASRECWEAAARRCPGMNRGEVHSALFIDCEKAKEF